MATRQEVVEAPVQESFPFMKLPAELRLRVYREVLQTEDCEQEILMDISELCGDEEFYDLHPNILRTCRQVHDEAVEVLYGENIFIINYIDSNNPNTSRVKRVSFQISYSDGIDLLTVEFLHDHPDLTHLFLTCDSGMIEMEVVQNAVENSLRVALQGHNRLTNLEIHVERVENPLSSQSIDFCWRLYSIVRQNRVAVYGSRPEQTEHDAPGYPPFLSVYAPWYDDSSQ
jgi:hypothetical protein